MSLRGIKLAKAPIQTGGCFVCLFKLMRGHGANHNPPFSILNSPEPRLGLGRIVRPLLASLILIWASTIWLSAASDPAAANLAREARKAQDRGQVVRAYMLFAEAAARDPHNPAYRIQRDAMKPLADLMTKADISSAAPPIAENDATAASEGSGLPEISRLDLKDAEQLLPPPALQVSPETHDINLRGDSKAILTQAARTWGIEVIFDPDLVARPDLRLTLTGADFRTAMDAATFATGTFLFAVAPRRIFVANDTDLKRTEFEPQVAMAVELPNAFIPREAAEAVNAVRQIIGNKGLIALDTAGNRIIVRDHVTRARAARALLEALVLPKAQVSFNVQLLSVDSDVLYQYGISWQSASQIVPLGVFGRLSQVTFPSIANATQFAAFGGGATIFGFSLTSASVLGTFSKSNSRILYDANVVVSDGQSASMHVGDRYPIPTALYAGAALTSGSTAYNPIGQVNQQDLGLKLKLEPHVHGDSSIGLALEASFQTLGNVVLNTVPSINQRDVKGSVTLEEGQWAIIAGIQEDTTSLSHSGIPGLANIPLLKTAFTQTTREHRKTDLLVLIKPSITRLPMSSNISPQLLLGTQRGARVLL